ncbi:MAG: FAD-binding oxidoreductase [Candidatus Nitrosotenuis sp.]
MEEQIQNMDAHTLQKKIQGQVFTSEEFLNFYSVDSSFYQIKPKLVVIPKTVTDVITVVRFARKNGLSITPRGGGTGLVGSALNDGIILDMKNFDKIRLKQNYVNVGAGANKGILDRVLEQHKKFLGPNPSVGPYCTIGGMIGTNASGSRSIKYGGTIDNLLGVKIVTANGKIESLPSKNSLSKSILAFAQMIDKSKFPHVSKNSCGYRLDAVDDISNTHKVIAASEGTLAIIISARLRVYDIPNKRTLLILGYKSVNDAFDDCKRLANLDLSALEFIDYTTMKNIKTKFPQKTKCLLFVEFDSDIAKNIKKLTKISTGSILYHLNSKTLITKWWNYRNSALHFSLKNMLSKETVPHIIEDATVPLDALDKLLVLVCHIRKKYHARVVMYGHAGNGNIHVRLASKNKNKKTIDCLASEFFSKIIEMNGTITGEHGDGIARSKFVCRQYGKKNYQIFIRMKDRLDPKNILNPHKIVTV